MPLCAPQRLPTPSSRSCGALTVGKRGAFAAGSAVRTSRDGFWIASRNTRWLLLSIALRSTLVRYRAPPRTTKEVRNSYETIILVSAELSADNGVGRNVD